jgi:quercetin dioxygenase-like cupin family protein
MEFTTTNPMRQQTTDLHVNPSEETLRLGSLAVRFLITGENSSGSVAAFELFVPSAERLTAPAHSHDHYEETIYGIDGVLTWTVVRRHGLTPTPPARGF